MSSHRQIKGINLSQAFLDSWARSAHARLEDSQRIMKTKQKIPTLKWVQTYSRFVPQKIREQFSGAMFGENSLVNDPATKARVMMVFQKDTEIPRKYSEFIPITATAMMVSLRKGFEIR